MRKSEFALIDKIRDEEFQKGKEAAVSFLVNNCYIRFGFEKEYIMKQMKDVKRHDTSERTDQNIY